jgi:hypothetical protein
MAGGDERDRVGPVIVRRRPLPASARTLLWVAVGLGGIAVVAPLAAFLPAGWTVGDRAAVVQASTSWTALVVALVAGAIAIAAYTTSKQQPDLAMQARNSLSTIWVSLVNEGTVTALHPFVRLDFKNMEVMGECPSGWTCLLGEMDGSILSMDWMPMDLVIHPTVTHKLPPFFFPADQEPARLSCEITWACDGAPAKSQSIDFSFPSAR